MLTGGFQHLLYQSTDELVGIAINACQKECTSACCPHCLPVLTGLLTPSPHVYKVLTRGLRLWNTALSNVLNPECIDTSYTCRFHAHELAIVFTVAFCSWFM